VSAGGAIVCALCGFAYEPGGEACRERGCPFAHGACHTLDCPRCGYSVPDERESVLARFVRRLFAPVVLPSHARTLADVRPGNDAVIDGIDGGPALAARLTAQGLAPDVVVHLVQRSPSYVIEVGETTLALERGVAGVIRVR
jgi:Fe2+ transport system protein FeoA